MGKYGEREKHVTSIVMDDELVVGTQNANAFNRDYEALLDMLECERNEKEYDWMSNYFLPEFASIILSDASDWANQYFQTRGFVEVKLEGDNPDDEAKCKAAKLCLNKTLNMREIYHYQKYIRARLINALAGHVYALCWWETLRNNRVIGYTTKQVPTGMDSMGNPIVNPIMQEEVFDEVDEEVVDNSIVYDRFNYDIIDPRNIFVDPKYSYTVQDKDWVIIRSQKTYDDLKMDEEYNHYINLDECEKLMTGRNDTITETDNNTLKRDTNKQVPSKPVNKYFDVYERYGKMWCTVMKRDDNNKPTEVRPGFNKEGGIANNAVLLETIITYAVQGGTKVLIRFEVTPFVDSKGLPYKPIVRGWCYIHPSKDDGMSDGKFMRELQIALNDQFNLSNDRTMLATMPTLKGKKYALQDNSTIYFEPEHVMELESPDDVVEFKIADDIQGSLAQQQMLKSFMEQVTAKFPTAMGELPRQASTTATAVAETTNKAGGRSNYKSLTIEYTYLAELYNMILQMTYQFMQPETARRIFGDELIEKFDPDGDYTFQPVSGNIEEEYSRAKKLQIIDQMMGRLVNVPNPNTMKVLNYLLSKAFELLGSEFPEYKKFLFDESAPPPPPQGQQGGAEGNPMGIEGMVSGAMNQSGVPQQPQIEATQQAMTPPGG
jgi:hypothetical protein